MRPSLSHVLLAASLGAFTACIVELQPNGFCGDGFVDDIVLDEQCEPGPGSCPGFCESLGLKPREGGACGNTCKCEESACDRCGDGKVDPEEQCEPGDLNGATCPGDGTPTCTTDCKLDFSACDPCGNGELDIDEECDPGMEPADIAVEQVSCTDLVSPAGVSRRYGSGVSAKCTRECLWDRSYCSYCNNNQLDGAAAVDFDGKIKLEPEICDGGAADDDQLEEHCLGLCGGNYRVRCNYTCSTDCRAFGAPPEPLACCTPRGETCPYKPGTNELPAGRYPCCWAVQNPDDDEPCQQIVNLAGQQVTACK